MIMCDTDSYMMEVTCPSQPPLLPYRQLLAASSDQSLFIKLDGSAFNSDDDRPEIRAYYSATKDNARALGFVKDEMGSKIISQAVGLASKVHAIEYVDRETQIYSEITKAKGCPKLTLKQSFNFATYKQMFQENIVFKMGEIVTIRSKGHQIKTLRARKKCLSIRDDKRYIKQANDPDTLAFGHWRLQQEHTEPEHVCVEEEEWSEKHAEWSGESDDEDDDFEDGGYR